MFSIDTNISPPRLVLIQARMGSSRLPGKMLLPLPPDGKPLLTHLLRRIAPRNWQDYQIVLATSVHASDDPIAQLCREQQVRCFRGSEDDVLSRFYHATLAQQLDLLPQSPVMRICADNPLLHRDMLYWAFEQYEKHNLDYFSNSFAPHYEDGIALEIAAFRALEQAYQCANLASQREHVTPYIKESGLFLCAYRKYHPNYQYKLSVDTEQDYLNNCHIFQALSLPLLDFASDFAPDFDIAQVVAFMETQGKDLFGTRTGFLEGYKKSLANDFVMNLTK